MNNRFSIFKYLPVALFVLFASLPGRAQTSLDSLPRLDSLGAEQLAGLASRIFVETKNLEGRLSARAENSQQQRERREAEVALARRDSTLPKPVLDSLATLLKTARAAERAAQNDLKKASKAAAVSEKTAALEPELQRKNLPKAWQALLDLRKMNLPTEAPSPDEASMATEKKSKVRPKKEKKAEEQPVANILTGSARDSSGLEADSAAVTQRKAARESERKNPKSKAPDSRFAAYDPAQDVMLHPPAPPCQLALNARDEFTGATLREVQTGELFRFTPQALRSFLEGKDQIVCEAALASAGPNASLWLTFRINDPNTRRAFGNLAKNSFALLTFTDGSVLNVNDLRSDEGSIDPDTRLVTYRAQYPLDAAALRKIRNTELDRIRIAWSTGYEDYDVQQVDVLMRQAGCLGE